MNIIKVFLVAGFGVLLSFSALAAEEGALTAGGSTQISVDPAATLGCSLLANGVRINLSANVEGYYACDFANSDIRIGTCHVAGSRAEQTVVCNEDDDGNFQTSQCSTDGDTVTYTDRSGFVATSTGGSVGQASLDGATCSGANISGLPFFGS